MYQSYQKVLPESKIVGKSESNVAIEGHWRQLRVILELPKAKCHQKYVPPWYMVDVAAAADNNWTFKIIFFPLLQKKFRQNDKNYFSWNKLGMQY